LGITGDPQPAKSIESQKAEAPTKAPAAADVRAEIHRTLADLIEARSADKPDPAKVDELTRKLQELRGKLVAQATVAAGGAQDGWVCPWGGPGLGAGRGPGRGAAVGPGFGRGWGGGGGRGLGPGAGQGLAPGGAAFVDQDHNGVCDYYELRHGKRPQ
jgi:hypothetical protein